MQDAVLKAKNKLASESLLSRSKSSLKSGNAGSCKVKRHETGLVHKSGSSQVRTVSTVVTALFTWGMCGFQFSAVPTTPYSFVHLDSFNSSTNLDLVLGAWVWDL